MKISSTGTPFRFWYARATRYRTRPSTYTPIMNPNDASVATPLQGMRYRYVTYPMKSNVTMPLIVSHGIPARRWFAGDDSKICLVDFLYGKMIPEIATAMNVSVPPPRNALKP